VTGFNVAAEAYDQFMGRYSRLLAPQLADLAGVETGQRAIDVGCGPGALTAVLAERIGPGNIAAVDPSEPFVAAARERFPGVDVRVATAESLPFGDGGFDVALAQLVVHFMTDPVGGLAEMRRVTRRGGVVVACVWDFHGGRSPLSPFWTAIAEMEPGHTGESLYAGARQGHLVDLFRAAGLRDVTEHELVADMQHQTFEEWWDPFTNGVGPAGSLAASLDEDRRRDLRARIRAALPEPPFTLTARAWAARGVA
jgi:ubiquinone/menaquinone biosynthesis C-methylase UbiE